MLDVPDAIPVTNPVDESTVALAGTLLLHAPVPPPNTNEFAEYIAVAPMHKGEVPETEDMLAIGFTVIVAEFEFTKREQDPLTTQRYLYPFIPVVADVMFRV